MRAWRNAMRTRILYDAFAALSVLSGLCVVYFSFWMDNASFLFLGLFLVLSGTLVRQVGRIGDLETRIADLERRFERRE